MDSAHALEKWSITEIIEDKGTFYLAMKTDHRPQTVQNLDEVKVKLRMKILREKREQIQSSFRERIPLPTKRMTETRIQIHQRSPSQ